MFIIVFNQSNITNDGTNSELVYKFPNSVELKDKYIAVSSISMYYSWFNIIAEVYANNIFTYTWTTGLTDGDTVTYTVNIPNGLFEITDINNYIQFVCIQNGTYWTQNGNNVYPFEILVNPSRYAVQLNTYLLPSTLPIGATTPPNFPGLPGIPIQCVVSFPSNFNKIVGYQAGFISNNNLNNGYIPPTKPSKAQNFVAKLPNGTLSYLSSQAPAVQPNSNVLFSISNVNNPYSIPSSIIYSLTPNVAVGAIINEVPPNFMWNRMIDGTYNELRLQLKGTNGDRLIIQDPQMTILLTIKDKHETSGN